MDMKQILESNRKNRRVEVIPERSINNLTVSVLGYNCNLYSYTPVLDRFLNKYKYYIDTQRSTIHLQNGVFQTVVIFQKNINLNFKDNKIILIEGNSW